MVFDYKILPFRKEDIDSVSGIRGFSERRKTVIRKLRRDRRRTRYDRRKGVRDGVIVSLSSQAKENRRKVRDRRNLSGERRKSDARFVL